MFRRADVKSKGRRVFAVFILDIVGKNDKDGYNESFSRFNGNNGKKVRKFQKDLPTESGYLSKKGITLNVYVRFNMDLKNMLPISTVSLKLIILKQIYNLEIQSSMVMEFVEQSGVNEIRSRCCLQDSDWNFFLASDKF
uniref:TAP-C domain-containing protein n=1 Tax=Strongyloides papillosus TaxID=174720 RepID=A0A0N5B612_STREA